MGEVPIPVGYTYDAAIWCNMCALQAFNIKGSTLSIKTHEELWQKAADSADSDDDEATPIAIYSWEEGHPHGEHCQGCGDEVSPSWCEAADTGNAGNGICGDCNIVGNARMEDQYE